MKKPSSNDFPYLASYLLLLCDYFHPVAERDDEERWFLGLMQDSRYEFNLLEDKEAPSRGFTHLQQIWRLNVSSLFIKLVPHNPRKFMDFDAAVSTFISRKYIEGDDYYPPWEDPDFPNLGDLDNLIEI